ncbi:hypothetical protein BDY19DRAFT_945435 [Irpex rosettiformis]|uniref:Uncharacterized protein n=1 Tax=Irpex rosettiformis TaxID=378272 RepID=A0ACB8U4W2_9APHY|nr:hypothetical protein BDY19DRAFT_945435 [Irpex rosettiformis]
MPQSYVRRYSDYPPQARIPLEARRRSSYALAPASSPTSLSPRILNNASNSDPRPIDADDSIVLSDLIRTGEQSRLRRRGAMRLDHGLANTTTRLASAGGGPVGGINGASQLQGSQTPPAPGRTGGTFTRPSTPPWLMPYPSGVPGEDDGAGFNGEPWGWTGDEEGSTRSVGDAVGAGAGSGVEDSRRGGAEPEGVEESFILYCGGEEVGGGSQEDYTKPYEPSSLPWGSSSSSLPRRKTQAAHGHHRHQSPSRKTNGCGAVVHVRAFPQKPRGVWVGKEEATEVVVGMDQAYFERTVVARMMKSACGCVREGIGCAVCGNPLGTRYMPCQAASEGLFSANGSHGAAIRNPRPLYPSGPRYWQTLRPSLSRSNASSSASPSRSGTPRPSQGSFYVYTFFANQVSSSPTCSFPPPPKLPQRSPEIITPYMPESSSDPTRTTWLGYTRTASPSPYSPTFAPAPSNLFGPRSRSRSRSPTRRSPGLSLAIPQAVISASGGVAVGLPITLRNERIQPGSDRGQLDADGVPLGEGDGDDITEPGSPDKTDGMLWSGR